MKFTDRSIMALSATGERYEVSASNESGLRLRISATGSKTFVYVFHRDGKLHTLILGELGDITLDAAHKTQSALRKRVQSGESVRSLRAFIRAGRPSSKYTVANLAMEWLESRVKIERKSWQEVERMLEKDVIPYLGDRPVKAVKSREITEMLEVIVDRGSPVTANRCAAMVKLMFKFAVHRGMVDANPCVVLEKPGGTELARVRNQSDNEIKRFWTKLDTADMSPRLRAAVRMLLVTAQCRGELAQAAKTEFDADAKIWRIPAAHSKIGKAHDVPLSTLALELLDQLTEVAGDSNFLLPSPIVKGKSIRADALTRAINRNRAHFKIDAFNVSDLRRTAASMMAAIGIPRLHVLKVLNRSRRNVTGIDDRHDYLNEKRDALELWADTLRAIIEGNH